MDRTKITTRRDEKHLRFWKRAVDQDTEFQSDGKVWNTNSFFRDFAKNLVERVKTTPWNMTVNSLRLSEAYKRQ